MPGVGDGQGGLACCDSWGLKESGMTERLNWTCEIYKHGSLLPCGTTQSAPDIRHKIQKATVGPQIPKSNLLQLTYLVFNNRDMAKKAECTLRNMQKAQKITMALSAQRPPTESLVFLGQSDSGRPQCPWVSIQPQCTLCGQKGHWRKDYS